MAEGRTLTVFGAGGATGQEVVRQASAAGWAVRAVEPDWQPEARAALPAGAEPLTGDVLKDDLAPHVRGADAVISTLGVGFSPSALIDPPPLYTEGTRNIVRAMRAEGVRRLVVVSATFVATRDRGPLHFRLPASIALHYVLGEMEEMERLLSAAQDIDWTAVRPGWLLDAPLTGDYVVTPDAIREDLIRTRHADLAHFMLACVERGEWVRGTPAIARAEDEEVSAPSAVLKEMTGG